MNINNSSKAAEGLQIECQATRDGERPDMPALGLPPDWGGKLEELSELLERRLTRLEQAMGLQPLT